MVTSPSQKTRFQRARSDDQKELRRQVIVDAARSYLMEVGFECFSMGPLAKAAGISRSTLYLYFPTREELLYTLHLEALHAWHDAFVDSADPEMPAEEYVAAFFDSAQRTPLILQTLPRVPTVLEHNVSVACLIDGKRQNRVIAQSVIQHVARAFGVAEPVAFGLTQGLLALLIGATHGLQQPDVDLAALPQDVQEELAAMDPRGVFLRSALWLVRGASEADERGG